MSTVPSRETKTDAMEAAAPVETVASLYERLKKPILALGFQMLGDAALAEDVLQETFLLVHRHLEQFRGEAQIDTWVYRIAMRTALRLRQKAQRQPIPAGTMGEHGGGIEQDSAAAREDESRRLYAALDRLSPDHRAVITLLSIREIPVRQVADILGVPEGTVWSRAYHARRKLRGLLAHEQPQGSTVADK